MLEAALANHKVKPRPTELGNELPKLTLEVQLREADAALALRMVPDEKRLAELQAQLKLLQERQDVRRLRNKLEEQALSSAHAAPPDVGVRILRIRKGQ